MGCYMETMHLQVYTMPEYFVLLRTIFMAFESSKLIVRHPLKFVLGCKVGQRLRDMSEIIIMQPSSLSDFPSFFSYF